MCLIFLLLCTKIESNLNTGSCFMTVFSQTWIKNKNKEVSNFLKACISGMASKLTSDLVCVISQYAGTCTTNLVLLRLEIMEPLMLKKLHFVLCINVIRLCEHALFCWATRHMTHYCVSWFIHIFWYPKKILLLYTLCMQYSWWQYCQVIRCNSVGVQVFTCTKQVLTSAWQKFDL